MEPVQMHLSVACLRDHDHVCEFENREVTAPHTLAPFAVDVSSRANLAARRLCQ